MLNINQNILLFTCFLFANPTTAQTFSEEFRKEQANLQAEFETFRKEAKDDYESFRKKINQEYAEALKDPWHKINIEPRIERPVEPDPAPIVWDDEGSDGNLTPSPITIKDVITPAPPAPPVTPVEPIVPTVSPDPARNSITFYGTPVKFADHNWKGLKLSNIDEASISTAWGWLNDRNSDATIADLLQLRDSMALPDWGYFRLVDEVAREQYKENSPEHTMMMAFILSQSGYKIRLAREGNFLNLYFDSPGIFFDRGYVMTDGAKLWPYNIHNWNGGIYISQVKFPGEQSLSVALNKTPVFKYSPAEEREVCVKNYPDVKLNVAVNKNLINFYNDYPVATVDNSQYSIWANVARTPASKEIEQNVYSKLRSLVKDKSQREALSLLIKVAQSFPYGYDNEIWGDDRIFWMEESWFYPFSDCEDHAINFVKMVNAVLNLKTAVVYYPGHLYSAIATTDGTLEGDYIIYNGIKYIVCDPTYFYAPPGKTAPDMINSDAILIPVE